MAFNGLFFSLFFLSLFFPPLSIVYTAETAASSKNPDTPASFDSVILCLSLIIIIVVNAREEREKDKRFKDDDVLEQKHYET
jgi:hypothetical protein